MINVGKNNESIRVDWIQQALARIPSGGIILDAGAGEQQFKKFCSHLKYVSQDFGQYQGEGDGKGLQMGKWDQSSLDIISDITSIPRPDSSFDAILCTEVFEHLPDPILAIKEFSRLLKERGYLIITAPFCSLTHFAPYHFYTGFSQYFYKTQLGKFGFDILEIKLNGNFFEYLAQEIRRLNSVSQKYAKTRLNFLEYIIAGLMLLILERLSRRDKGSDELLCFGYHILAIKRII